MDLIILLSVFIAFLALAYVTYRNVYNLDSRLRQIEDILKNAQVVAEPPMRHEHSQAQAQAQAQSQTQAQTHAHAHAHAHAQAHEHSPLYASRYQPEGVVPGWGGEGVVPQKVTVAKEDHNTRTIEIIPDVESESESDDNVSDDNVSDGNDADDEGSDDIAVDDILNEMEKEDQLESSENVKSEEDAESESEEERARVQVETATVAGLRKTLRDAGVTIPGGVKKADLVRMVDNLSSSRIERVERVEDETA